VVILSVLARGRADSAESFSATFVSHATNLPEPTVAKILKLLTQGQILESVRGAGGGYKLLKAPSDITVADIVLAVEGPVSVTSCAESSGACCDYHLHCALKGKWDVVNQAIRQTLARISLHDMVGGQPV